MSLYYEDSYNKRYFRKDSYSDEYRSIMTKKCKCGHSIQIFKREGYDICSYCGRMVFISDKHKFKYNMKRRNIC